MKTAIVGAGAIGSLLAHRLVATGLPVTIIDQPTRVACLKAHGLRVIDTDGRETIAHAHRVVDCFSSAGQHDLVILATKANDLPRIATGVAGLLHPDTVVMTLQNGIPWWYFERMPAVPGLHRCPSGLHRLDPSGCLRRAIPAENIIGCVAYPAANMHADGRVEHVEGDRFPIGELDGETRPRTETLARTLEDAGFRSRILDDIRGEIWLKAWGALSLNPISALTHGTMSGICQHPPTRELVATMMAEAQCVAERLGITFRHTIDKRIAGAEAVGPHKTSMLQDREAGRLMETDALIGSILELAEITGTPAPSIAAVHACVSLLNETVCRTG